MKTVIKAGSELIWLDWVAIEIESKEIIGINISKERKNMFVVAERFMSNIIDEYGENPVSTKDDGGTWYPPQQAYQFLKLSHHIHFPYEKSIIIERECNIKDRTLNVLMMTTFHAEKRRNVN